MTWTFHKKGQPKGNPVIYIPVSKWICSFQDLQTRIKIYGGWSIFQRLRINMRASCKLFNLETDIMTDGYLHLHAFMHMKCQGVISAHRSWGIKFPKAIVKCKLIKLIIHFLIHQTLTEARPFLSHKVSVNIIKEIITTKMTDSGKEKRKEIKDNLKNPVFQFH